jgi:ribosomal protein L40E
MEPTCYRCSATLEPDAYYCPNCGAPQVRFVAQEESASLNDAHPTPAPIVSGAEPGAEIQWKLAIPLAASIAIAAGVLSTLLAAGSVLWAILAAVLVIGMYRRRRPSLSIGRSAGARIGALVGLFAAFISLAGNAVFLLVQRYGMHQGNLIDTQLTGIVKQASARAAAMDPQAPIASFTNFWLSAEGRIGLILLTMGFLAGLILLFAIAGGVLGAQIYRSPRRKPAA